MSGAGGADTVSSAARVPASRSPVQPRTTCSSCSAVRAPTSADATPGRPVSQDSAMSAGVRPCCSAADRTASRIRQVRGVPRRSHASTPRPGSSPSRLAPVGGSPSRYFPVSQPEARGPHARQASPACSAAGSTSHSTSRASRLYWDWWLTRRGSSTSAASAAICHPGRLLTPTWPTRPDPSASAKKVATSSSGVRRSGPCTWYSSTSSTPSRRRLASSARRRYSARRLAPGCPETANRPFVARRTRSRTPGRRASQDPMTSSERPSA